MEILSASLYDIVKGNGTNVLTADGLFVFDFTGNTTVTNGSTFAVLQNWSLVTTNGATYTVVGLNDALSLDTSNLASTGFVTVIPEPAAIGLLGFGALASILIHRLRRWAMR